MEYWLFVLVCLIIHIVVNIDNFRKKPTVNLPAINSYRVFSVTIALYFVVDFLWGIFDKNKLPLALYIDTFIYFILMGFTILAWTQYVSKYLKSGKWFRRILLYTGNAFFLAEVVLLIVNFFVPILFSVNMETTEYTAYAARYVMLYTQIAFYLLLTIYTLIYAFSHKDNIRRRYFTIASYSILMGSAIVIQVFDPLLPIYSAGLIIGSTLLNAFVINDIKEEYKTELEQSRLLVQQGQEQLSETIIIAYTDPLTGIKNKHAYVEEEQKIDDLIAQNKMEDFAVIVFDLNGLKMINDTKGHESGDTYIVDSCRIIEKYFGKDNLYRFGGDEFVSIITGTAYENINNTLSEFERYVETCLNTNKPIISSGMSRFRKGKDNTYLAVFKRADKLMYSRKDALKERLETLN